MSYPQSSPYQQGPAQEAGHGYGQTNTYDAQNDYQLRDYNNNNNGPQTSSQQPGHGAASTSGSPPLNQQAFLTRVQNLRNDINGLTGEIGTIARMHQHALGAADQQQLVDNQQFDMIAEQSQRRSTAIKDGIKDLERDLARTTDKTRKTKQTQLQSLKTFFKSELDSYQSMEREYRQKYRDQISRQYRIVNPDASDREVQEAVEADWSKEGVFQTALRSNRTGQANSLLGNVRARHGELQRIEKNLAEIAVLYQELATMVEQQDPVVAEAELKAADVVDNLQSGNAQVAQANKSARNRRKLKWWCFFIVILILIALALGIGLGITLTKKAAQTTTG